MAYEKGKKWSLYTHLAACWCVRRHTLQQELGVWLVWGLLAFPIKNAGSVSRLRAVIGNQSHDSSADSGVRSFHSSKEHWHLAPRAGLGVCTYEKQVVLSVVHLFV